MTRLVFRFAFLGSILAGCSLVLDDDRHRGGSESDGGPVDAADAGMCDMDGDGFRAMGDCGGMDCDDSNPARYPGAPPICGNGQEESCPGVDIPRIFTGTVARGLIPATLLLDDSSFIPELAAVGTSFGGGGFGQVIVFAMESSDSDANRPVRFDVPLDDINGGQRGLLRENSSGDDLGAVADVTSVDARTYLEESQNRIGVKFTHSGSANVWAGIVDLAAGTANLSHNTPNTVLDEPGVMDRYQVERRSVSPTTLYWSTSGRPAFTWDSTNADVPGANPIRLVSTDGLFFMLQDEAEAFWFWGIDVGGDVPLTTDGWTNQTGKAAFALVDGETYVLVFEREGEFWFVPYLCDLETGCAMQASVIPEATVPSGPAGGEVPDAHVLDDGRVVAALTERHNDGDHLVLQILDASLYDITTSRLSLLDLRGTGQRITDARMDLIEAPEARTLAVAATLRDGDSGNAQRIMLAGLRACTEN